MRKGFTHGVYNILLPIWLLVLVPTWLWLLLIPANYLIDRLVLGWGLPATVDHHSFCRQHTWKVCLLGFVADFIGAAALVLIAYAWLGLSPQDWLQEVGYHLAFNPFAHPLSLALCLFAVALAAVCIYGFDRHLLRKAGLDLQQAHDCALRLAVVTAPYLFLLPSELLYG